MQLRSGKSIGNKREKELDRSMYIYIFPYLNFRIIVTSDIFANQEVITVSLKQYHSITVLNGQAVSLNYKRRSMR